LLCCYVDTYALGKLGNIVVETFVILDVSSNVFMFPCLPTHDLWKHCCGNKICFPILITATVTVSGVMIGGGRGAGAVIEM
jgi:hypothetical protein